MSFTDAPIPNTGDAKFDFWRLGVDENIQRLDAKTFGRGDVVIPTIGGQLGSGFVSTGVDSTSFTTAYTAHSRRYYRDCLVVRHTVVAPGSGAIEVRLRLPNQNVNSDALAISSGATAIVLWQWEHGQDTSEVAGTEMTLEIQTRRTSGSGSIIMFNPGQVTFTPASVLPDSDSGGNPVIE